MTAVFAMHNLFLSTLFCRSCISRAPYPLPTPPCDLSPYFLSPKSEEKGEGDSSFFASASFRTAFMKSSWTT